MEPTLRGHWNFDLRDFQRQGWTIGGSRIKYYGNLLALFVWVLLFTWAYLSRVGSQGLNSLTLTVFIVGPAVAAFLAWAWKIYALGAVKLAVSPASIDLIYASGKVRSYDLLDPNVKLKVCGRDSPPLGVRQWRIQGGFPLVSYIPVEARDAILATAQAGGLSVSQRRFQGETWLTIHGPSSLGKHLATSSPAPRTNG